MSSPLRDHAAWAFLDQSTVLAKGGDAVRFVDHFVTAAVGGLLVGRGTEAFVTDGRGHVMALVAILRTDVGLEVIAGSGSGPRLRDHLEHFHIREAVDLADATDGTRALVLSGPATDSVVAAIVAPSTALPTADLEHAQLTMAGHEVRVVRTVGRGVDGFWIRGTPVAIDAIALALASAGVPRASADDLESARIGAGYPSAIDIVEKTLPQELGRDARAISFTKGCYLGQETVARLDALGHVNRRLAIVAIETEEPLACPATVHLGDAVVGVLTSTCLDATSGQVLGLGILSTKALNADCLAVGTVRARVLAVPPSSEESS